MTSSAEKTVNVSLNGCQYTCYVETGEATVWEVDSKAESIVIPSEVTDDEGNKYTVTVFKSTRVNIKATSITLPSTVHTIEAGAFDRCETLRKVNLENVKYIGNSAFYGCENLEMVDLTSALAIDQGAFEGCQSMEGELKYGDGLEYIDTYAFKDCTKLTKVYFPASLKTIGTQAFSNSGLVEVLIPDNIENVYGGAFNNCASLKYVYLGKGITWQSVNGGSGVFKGCTTLETVVAECAEIPNSCFSGDKAITTIDLREGVKKIGIYAFSGSSIESLVIPDGLELIVPTAFENCTNLKMVTVGNSLEAGTRLFENSPIERVWIKHPTVCQWFCDNNTLTEIILGDEVKTIGHGAFRDLTALTSIRIPGNVETIEHDAFTRCTVLETVEFEEGLKTLDYNAFYDCIVMKEPKLPNSLLEIKRGAFTGCSFERLVIPDNVTTIEYGITGQLKVVSIPGPIENLKWIINATDTFIVRCEEPFDINSDYIYNKDAVLQVPSMVAVEKFRVYPTWKYFKTIVPAPVLHSLEGEMRLADVEGGESYDSEGIRNYRPTSESMKVAVKVINKDSKPYKDLVQVTLYTQDAEGNKSKVASQNILYELQSSGEEGDSKGEFVDFGAYDTEKVYSIEATYYSYGKEEICCSLPAFRVGILRKTPYDINCDDKLDARDIVEFVNLIGRKLVYPDISFADYNKDNVVNVADLIILINHIESLQDGQE